MGTSTRPPPAPKSPATDPAARLPRIRGTEFPIKKHLLRELFPEEGFLYGFYQLLALRTRSVRMWEVSPTVISTLSTRVLYQVL